MVGLSTLTLVAGLLSARLAGVDLPLPLSGNRSHTQSHDAAMHPQDSDLLASDPTLSGVSSHSDHGRPVTETLETPKGYEMGGHDHGMPPTEMAQAPDEYMMALSEHDHGQMMAVPGDPSGNPLDSWSASLTVDEILIGVRVYLVQEGDSLLGIAKRFGITPETVQYANGLSDPNLIRAGQKLKILPMSGLVHTVSRGETLLQVAASYNVSPSALREANGLADGDLLREGQLIIVPGEAPPGTVSRSS